MSNVKTSLQVPVIASLAPVSQAAGARSTGWIAAKDFFNYMAVISVGVLGGGATLDAKFEQATDGAGAGVKDVPGKALVQINASNKTGVINLCHNDIDVTNGFTHIRLTLTVAASASLTQANVFGADARLEQLSNTIADQTV